jgi:hypothetical protein
MRARALSPYWINMLLFLYRSEFALERAGIPAAPVT